MNLLLMKRTLDITLRAPTPTLKPSVAIDSVNNITSTTARIAFTVNNPGELTIGEYGVRLGIASGAGINFVMGMLNRSTVTISQTTWQKN